MKDILGYYLMPHPPIAVPEVGDNRKIKATVDACLDVGRKIKGLAPETIIVVTPHGVMFSDAVAISFGERISGDLSRFRARSVRFEKKIDAGLTREIATLSQADGIPVAKLTEKYLAGYDRRYELDHGTIVPLYFIEKSYSDYELVHITYGLLGGLELYRFGVKIREATRNLGRRAVIIASGDLSHRLTPDGPYPYSPRGREFDEKLLSLLEAGDAEGILNLDPVLVEEAGECALRSVYILLGSLGGGFTGTRLSYEGPFGVGYGVMSFRAGANDNDAYARLAKASDERRRARAERSNDYVRLARASLEYYFKRRKTMPVPEEGFEELKGRRAAAFVSLKKHGALRGCIGTIVPTKDSLAAEIIENALSAGFRDPRFPPLREAELSETDISVDVLSSPEPARKEDLDPARYGVIVAKGRRRGLLLPALEGVDTVEEQLRIALDKAGISPNEDYLIERFEVKRYREGE